MDPYASSSGGPLNAGVGALQSAHSTISSHSGAPTGGPHDRGGAPGGPLSYGLPSYPSGGPPGGLLPPYGGSAADTSLHASMRLKETQSRTTDLPSIVPRGGAGTTSGCIYTSTSKYTGGETERYFPSFSSCFMVHINVELWVFA